jgi:hypothetical protein
LPNPSSSLQKYSLSNRPFLGPTSTSADLAFLMANQVFFSSPFKTCTLHYHHAPDKFAPLTYLYLLNILHTVSQGLLYLLNILHTVSQGLLYLLNILHTVSQGLCKPGSLVYDPFVGTGSLIVACAHFGSYVIGSDLDWKVK